MSLTGQTLNNRWQVGKMIGEGACAKVYSIAGPKQAFECVVKVIDLPKGSGKSKKDKEQTIICNTLHLEYMLYVGHLWNFPQKPQLPEKFYADDLNHNVRYLVMERFERDLVGYAEQSSLAPADVAAVGQQLLMGLRWIHSKGFLFVDVKPGNFMMKGSNVYFIDYGLAQRFTPYRGTVPPPCAFNGTPSFASIACMEGHTPAYRDDLEAMCYVLIAMTCRGEMPYPPGKSHEEVLNTKRTFDLKAYCVDNNVGELFEMVQICRALGHDELPKYEALDALLQRMSSKKAVAKNSSNGKNGGGQPATAAVAAEKATTSSSSKKRPSSSSSDTDATENDSSSGVNKKTSNAVASSATASPVLNVPKRAPTAAAKRKAEAAAAATAAAVAAAAEIGDEGKEQSEIVSGVTKARNVRARKTVTAAATAPVLNIDLTESPEPVAKKKPKSRSAPSAELLAPVPAPSGNDNASGTTTSRKSSGAGAGAGAAPVLTSPSASSLRGASASSTSSGSISPKRALASTSGAKRVIAAKLANFDGADDDDEAEKIDNFDAPPNSASKPRARPSVRSLVRSISNNSTTSLSSAATTPTPTATATATAAAEPAAVSPIRRGRSAAASTITASY